LPTPGFDAIANGYDLVETRLLTSEFGVPPGITMAGLI
jgi:hypothetical protein